MSHLDPERASPSAANDPARWVPREAEAHRDIAKHPDSPLAGGGRAPEWNMSVADFVAFF